MMMRNDNETTKKYERAFEELLEKSQIKSPRLFGKKRFEEKLEELKAQFCHYMKDVVDTEELIADYYQQLERHWGKKEDFPTPVKEEFSFKTLKEFETQLMEARKKIKNIKPFEWHSKIEKKYRKEWIDELVAQADEKCVLIVLRGAYTPYDFNLKKFNEYIEQKKPAVISIMGISPIWISFNPHEEYDTSFWGMDKLTTKVEFIAA